MSYISSLAKRSTTVVNYCFSTLLFTLFFTSCSGTPKDENPPDLPYQIDITEAYSQGGDVPLSSFAESIEYVALETTESSLIGRGAHFYALGDYIVSIAFRQVYLFDRKTGAFVKELKTYGQGPDEYRSTYPYVHPNEQQGLVYIRDNQQNYLGINTEEETKVSFKAPQNDESLIMAFAELGEGLFVGYHPNYDCKQKARLIVFNAEGQVIKTFPNHLSCTKLDNSISFDFQEGEFYQWAGNVGFKENFNDTLYRVSKDTMSVLAIFNSGQYGLVYENKLEFGGNNKEEFHLITEIDETANHLFFQLGFRGNIHSALLDKQTGQSQLVVSETSDLHAFKNDLDNFLPFRLDYATNDNQLVGFLEAPEVLSWLDENPGKTNGLSNELKAIGRLKPDDNPVVMVVKLKD